jgi:arylsulfatase
MRAQKGTPWLGGTRAAAFWRWPGRLAPADVGALAAHIDFLPTIAEIAGAQLDTHTQAQVEGRSLLPLLAEPKTPWPERTLFTHVGRWPRFSNPDDAKFTNCAVRTPRWHLVSIKGAAAPAWELYDVAADPGEKKNVISVHPDVAARLGTEYDVWWTAARAGLVNEQAIGPKLNPFAELYWKQFGGGPDDEDRRIMESTQKTVPPGRKDRAAAAK